MVKNPGPLEIFWEAMILCLLSTQQRAGPDSPITKFYSIDPFPLSLSNCLSCSNNLSDFIEETLTNFGGFRFAKKIGNQAGNNMLWLDDGGWNEINDFANDLLKCRKRAPLRSDIKLEKELANFINKNLSGFGPKQSRNLWQTLGLFRYEIPIDSRITKWLNKNVSPFKISTTALSDPYYYKFIMVGIQQLSVDCNVLPCILDATIFSTYDTEWNEVIW